MLSSIKTHVNKDSRLTFILSYSDEQEGATLSVFTSSESVTVKLAPEDLRALYDFASEAHFYSPDTPV